MNGLLHEGKPTASYWMYKWYGEMSGNMLPVTAAGDLDGIASLDGTRKVVNGVFGGDYGTNSVRVTGLSGFGTSARVTLSSTPETGRFTNVAAPTTLSTQTVSIVDGAVTVPVADMDARRAYQVVVTPASGPVTRCWARPPRPTDPTSDASTVPRTCGVTVMSTSPSRCQPAASTPSM
jgi:hypothetical protein